MDLAVESFDPSAAQPDAAFYFDLGEPECWIAAERVIAALGRPAPWIPVMAGDLPDTGHVDPAHWRESLDALSATASERNLLELRPPSSPQTDRREAMLAATFARQSGKTVAFTLAAMRQCWCAGRDLSDPDTIALAGAAAEIHPNALAKVVAMKSLAAELESQTRSAISAGVRRVPAVRLGAWVFHGDAGIDEAAGVVA